MLMFLKNPVKKCKAGKSFFPDVAIMFFEILTFDFYPKEKRQL